jgi:hypothetical protein
MRRAPPRAADRAPRASRSGSEIDGGDVPGRPSAGAGCDVRAAPRSRRRARRREPGGERPELRERARRPRRGRRSRSLAATLPRCHDTP